MAEPYRLITLTPTKPNKVSQLWLTMLSAMNDARSPADAQTTRAARERYQAARGEWLAALPQPKAAPRPAAPNFPKWLTALRLDSLPEYGALREAETVLGRYRSEASQLREQIEDATLFARSSDRRDERARAVAELDGAARSPAKLNTADPKAMAQRLHQIEGFLVPECKQRVEFAKRRLAEAGRPIVEAEYAKRIARPLVAAMTSVSELAQEHILARLYFDSLDIGTGGYLPALDAATFRESPHAAETSRLKIALTELRNFLSRAGR